MNVRTFSVHSLVSILLVGGLATTASADPAGIRYDAATIAQTRETLAAHADSGRNRTRNAILRIFGGAVMVAVGIEVYKDNPPAGGLVDMSGLARMSGIGLALGGGLLAGTTPAYLAESTPQAQIYSDFVAGVAAGDTDGAVRTARSRVREAADANAHLRHVMMGVMGGVTAGSLAAAIAGYKMHRSDGDAGEAVLGAGCLGAELGLVAMFVYAHETDVERMNDHLGAAPAMTAGIVPTRGGAVAGLAMSF